MLIRKRMLVKDFVAVCIQKTPKHFDGRSGFYTCWLLANGDTFGAWLPLGGQMADELVERDVRTFNEEDALRVEVQVKHYEGKTKYTIVDIREL